MDGRQRRFSRTEKAIAQLLYPFFACHVCLSPVSVCFSLPVDWAINHWFGKVKRELQPQPQPQPHKQRQQQSNYNKNNRNAALSVFRGFCTLRSCCQYVVDIAHSQSKTVGKFHKFCSVLISRLQLIFQGKSRGSHMYVHLGIMISYSFFL